MIRDFRRWPRGVAQGFVAQRRASFREAIPMPRLLGRASQNCKLHFSNPKVKRLRVNFSLHIA
ncbi:hypothetical protein [Paraburkholderia silvatlantica]|uniref:hypothetical protein n=1 Tax=Paraburkholderia silvatlantica TaxID=321895 RepID=UPI003750DB36